jgi:hypothetical protein
VGAGVRVRRLGLWGLAALSSLVIEGCRKPPAGCFVVGVSVAEGTALRAGALDRDELRQAALAAFGRTPGFGVPPEEPGRGVRRCRSTVALVDVQFPSRAGATGDVEVLVALSVAPGEDEEAIREVARYAEAVRPGETSTDALRRAIGKAASRAAAALALALAEADKPTADLVRDLESSDPRTRDLAVRVLGDRRNPAAVPALLQRLADPDPEVVERAVGALAQIRDPRAVGPLIGLTQRREGSFVAELVLIIGDIGGPEAEAYLDTLQAGHPDPNVRKAAREALGALRGRSAARPSAAPNR